MFIANEFKNGKWINSFEVFDLEDLENIISVVKKYFTEETMPDCWNMETKGGLVIAVIK